MTINHSIETCVCYSIIHDCVYVVYKYDILSIVSHFPELCGAKNYNIQMSRRSTLQKALHIPDKKTYQVTIWPYQLGAIRIPKPPPHITTALSQRHASKMGHTPVFIITTYMNTIFLANHEPNVADDETRLANNAQHPPPMQCKSKVSTARLNNFSFISYIVTFAVASASS